MSLCRLVSLFQWLGYFKSFIDNYRWKEGRLVFGGLSLSVWLVRNYPFQSWNSVWVLNEILSRSKWKASSLSDTAVFDQMTATTWNWLQYDIVSTSHRKSSGRFIVICHVWEIHSSLPLAYLSFSSSSSSTSVGSCVFYISSYLVCARARVLLLLAVLSSIFS